MRRKPGTLSSGQRVPVFVTSAQRMAARYLLRRGYYSKALELIANARRGNDGLRPRERARLATRYDKVAGSKTMPKRGGGEE